jgi:broad specificity phosphatase PhoE
MGDLQGKAVSPIALPSENRSIEKTELFASRAVKWWNISVVQYLSNLPTRDTPYQLLVVSHGGWIGMLVRTLVNSRKLRTAKGIAVGRCLNVSVTRIEIDSEDNRNGTVTKYGDVSHLVGNFVETNADELIPHF